MFRVVRHHISQLGNMMAISDIPHKQKSLPSPKRTRSRIWLAIVMRQRFVLLPDASNDRLKSREDDPWFGVYAPSYLPLPTSQQTTGYEPSFDTSHTQNIVRWSPRVASNRVFQVFDLFWRSPESGGLRYKSGKSRKTI